MTAFSYLAILCGHGHELRNLSFIAVEGMTFALFQADPGGYGRWRSYIITEENGEARECVAPYSYEEQATLRIESKRLLSLERSAITDDEATALKGSW